MSDMHQDINAHVHESRGYDRGFTAGVHRAHELINEYITYIKHKRAVMEEEHPRMDEMYRIQTQINTAEHLKLLIRKGHSDSC